MTELWFWSKLWSKIYQKDPIKIDFWIWWWILGKNSCSCDEEPASDQINYQYIPFENNFFFSLEKVTACSTVLKKKLNRVVSSAG